MAGRDADRRRTPQDGRKNGNGRHPDQDRGRRRSGTADGIASLANSAVQQLTAVTGKSAEFVSRVQPADDGWRLTVEVVEVARIPDSTSVLGSYEVRVNHEGSLLEYSRARRYLRSQSDDWAI